MSAERALTRRTVLLSAAGAAATGMLGRAAPGIARGSRPPLWRLAERNGIVFGTAIATWMFEDEPFMDLVDHEAALIFTMDDFLWYQLKPSRDAPLNFGPGDRIVELCEQNQQLVFGAHLVWDEGFGEGWAEGELFELSEQEARELLFGTLEAVVRRSRGRIAGWIVVNEAISEEGENGLRTDVPWYQTIGPSYVAEAFHLARQADPHATLVLNEFGFETVNEFGDRPEPRRCAALQVVDALLDEGVPVDAFGVQGHLLADRFAERFNARAYQRFLSELGDRGLAVLITEVDVLDDGLPADNRIRDRAIADVYARYLDAALAVPAVKSLMTFGLSDRYTWLQEDFPREDGAPRRPLPFDDELRPKPAYFALADALEDARDRRQLWRIPR